MIKVDGVWSFFAAWDLKAQTLGRKWARGCGGFGAHGQSANGFGSREESPEGSPEPSAGYEQEAKQADSGLTGPEPVMCGRVLGGQAGDMDGAQ